MANMEEYIFRVDAEVSRATAKLDKVRQLMNSIERLRNKGVDDYYTTNQKDMDKNMRSMKQLTYLYREMQNELNDIQRKMRDTADSMTIPDDASKEMKAQLSDMRAAMSQYASDLTEQQKEIQSSYKRTLAQFRELATFQQNYSKNFKHLFSSNDLYNLPNSGSKDAGKIAEEMERARNIVQTMASDVDDVSDRFNNVISKIKEVNKLERRTESMSRRASASNYMSYQQASSFMKDKRTVDEDYRREREHNLNAMVEMGRERTRLHQQIKNIEDNPTATQEQIDRKIAYQQEIQAMDKEYESRIELNKVLERTISNMQRYNASVQGIELKPERGTFWGMVYERAPAIGLALGGASGGVVGNLYNQGAGYSKGMRDDEITIGQRTDSDGATWRDAIRNGALNAGLKDRLGFTGQEMLTFQNNYLSNHGFTGMDDLNTAMQDQAIFSRVSGVSATDTNQLFSTLFGTGAVTGSQVKAFQDAFLGAIKRSGMEGREKEQLQALDGILTSMSQGRSLTNHEVMNAVGLQTVLSETGLRSLQGAQGGQLLSDMDQGIRGGFDDPMVRLVFGQGTQYQGVAGRFALRKQMDKGISDVSNVENMARFAQSMGTDPNVQAEAFASLADKMGINMTGEQAEAIMKLYREGQLTQDNLDKVNKESGVTGSATAEKRLKEYQESSAATDNQSDATTQKHAAQLYDFGEALREANAGMADWNTAAYTATIALGALAAAAAASAASFLVSAGVRSLAAGTMTAGGASRGVFGRLFGKGKGGGGVPPTGGGAPPGYSMTPGGILVPNGGGAAGGTTRNYSGPKTGWKATVGGWFDPNVKNGGLPNPGPGTAAAGTAASGASGLSKFLSGASKVLSKAALPLSLALGAYSIAKAPEDEKGRATGEAAGGILGGMAAGAAGGALAGTLGAGPIGTVVGGILGGIGGAFAGSGIGGWIGSMFDPDKASAAELTPEEQKKAAEAANQKADNKTKEMTDKENTNTKERTESKKTDNLQYERENLHMYEAILLKAQQLLQQARAQGGIFGNGGAVGGTGTSGSGGGGTAIGSNGSGTLQFLPEGQKFQSSNLTQSDLGYTDAKLTAADLNSWIDSKAPEGSLMRGMGDAFFQAGQESGLDPRYLIAHAAEETGWGTSNILKAKNNWFGIGAFDSSPMGSAFSFGDKSKGIIEGAKWIKSHYYDKGNKNLAAMEAAGYATNPQWDTNIASIMKNAPTGTGSVNVNSTITVNVKGDESVADKVNNSAEMKSVAQNLQQLIYGSVNYYSKEMRTV